MLKLSPGQADLAASGAAVARRVAVSIAPADTVADDYTGPALEGVCHAATRFDPARNVPFEAFAARGARSAIIDFQRANHWGPRDTMGAPSARTVETVPDFAPNAGTAVPDFADDACVAADISRLPARLRFVAAAYAAGYRPTEIAPLMGVTPSRVSQLRREAVEMLGAEYGGQ